MKEEAKDWVKKIIFAYNDLHITPYIHGFVHHFHEFINLHGNVNLFNEQALEKLNDITTSQFFRSTNKKNYVKQLINIRNRLLSYSEENKNLENN